MLFKLMSYSLPFPNFRWFVLTAQPTRALDVCPLVHYLGGGFLQDRGHDTKRRRHPRSSTAVQNDSNDDDHEDDEEE
jgi:hypothetical protein